jgi:hypothetical protein
MHLLTMATTSGTVSQPTELTPATATSSALKLPEPPASTSSPQQPNDTTSHR